MDPENADSPPPRPPTIEDLLRLCSSLNDQNAQYLIVGGIAMIQHGFTRTTEDIDLLLGASPENQAKVKKALEVLPDKAILEMGDDDLRDFVVVRVVDEIVIDLMLAACGIEYEEASREIEMKILDGVPIPFASPKLLLRMKQTYREKDVLDRQFLEAKIRGMS